MKAKIKLIQKYGLIALLPVLTGCNGGGGFAALGLGSLFSGSSGGGGPISLLDNGGDAIATIHQPEPASMLLMGSGLAAMAYFKSKNAK